MFEEPSRLKPQDDDPNDREPSRPVGDHRWALSADEQHWNEAVSQDVRPLEFDTQAADLFEDSNNASVLTTDAPDGPYVVETRVRLNLPAEGCCFNYVQAGLVVYGDDDRFVKLVHVSIWETRQTEFAKEVSRGDIPEGYPRYGNTVVGAPGEWTYLRIAKTTTGKGTIDGGYGGKERYTAYTSLDGETWTRGGTWTHDLGDDARIGLVSMGGSGFTAEFDYVRVSALRR